MTNEVTSLKESLDETSLKLGDFDRIAEKVGEISAENVGLKAALDEMTGQHAAADEKIKILETVLAQRYSGDPKSGHVRILNGRLFSVFKWSPDFKWFISLRPFIISTYFLFI